MKSFLHGHYYWVRRRSHVDDKQVTTVPAWEPMLWDEKTKHFYNRCDTRAYAPEDLQEVGSHIGNFPGPRRITRKGWMPTTPDRRTGKACPCPEEIKFAKRAAKLCGDGPPIPVEVSWLAEDQSDANRQVRDAIRKGRA